MLHYTSIVLSYINCPFTKAPAEGVQSMGKAFTCPKSITETLEKSVQ